jgi:cytochrome P450
MTRMVHLFDGDQALQSLIANVKIASPAFKANPQPFYQRLRAEAPVCRVPLPGKQSAWLVTRYDDVAAVLKDSRFIKEKARAFSAEQAARQPWVPKAFKPLERNMLDVDPPDHTRLRALVHKAFTPCLIDNLRGRIQSLTDELLNAVDRKGSVDLIRDYALPLPTIVIAEMLGVPARDRHRFHRWSSGLLSASPNAWGMIRAIPCVLSFLRYIRKLIKSRREHPRDDLSSALVQARESGDRLSEDELLSMIFLLLIAGHETTVNLIGNGILSLLDHPESMDQLRNDPELIQPAVEELLRYNGPIATATERYTSEDVTLAGVMIPRGELVFAGIASANRDERQFVNPDDLDLTREPNRHLAFGMGIHYCVGAPLARLEGQIAINTLLHRLPALKLGVPRDRLRWRPGLVLHGLKELPLVFTGRAARTSVPHRALRIGGE